MISNLKSKLKAMSSSSHSVKNVTSSKDTVQTGETTRAAGNGTLKGADPADDLIAAEKASSRNCLSTAENTSPFNRFNTAGKSDPAASSITDVKTSPVADITTTENTSFAADSTVEKSSFTADSTVEKTSFAIDNSSAISPAEVTSPAGITNCVEGFSHANSSVPADEHSSAVGSGLSIKPAVVEEHSAFTAASPGNITRGSFDGIIIKLSESDGEFVRKRTAYAFNQSYGRISLSDLLTAPFKDSQWWTRLDEELPLEDIVFLDTETTGLAGGTGTVAFLIGLGYIDKDGLIVDQYLMRDFDEEYPMLQAVMAVLRRFKVLVTFNGKSFDWPLLESRLIYNRLRPVNWEDSHLDLLHIARRLWSSRLENCSLTSLEENILDRHREDDIPGSQIPNIYLEYLQTRKTDEMERVIRHNEWDIAAMAAVLVHVAGLYNDPQNKGDSYELFGIARELERNHRIREAAACYRACIGSAAHHSLSLDAKKRYAYLTKRHKGPQEAMDLWAELAGEEGSLLIFPLIEMAKCLEHKEKDFQRALECTDKAIKLVNKTQSAGSQRLREELNNRRQRLLKKMERSMELWG